MADALRDAAPTAQVNLQRVRGELEETFGTPLSAGFFVVVVGFFCLFCFCFVLFLFCFVLLLCVCSVFFPVLIPNEFFLCYIFFLFCNYLPTSTSPRVCAPAGCVPVPVPGGLPHPGVSPTRRIKQLWLLSNPGQGPGRARKNSGAD